MNFARISARLVDGAMCAMMMLVVAFASHRWIAWPLHRASAATRAIAAGDPIEIGVEYTEIGARGGKPIQAQPLGQAPQRLDEVPTLDAVHVGHTNSKGCTTVQTPRALG